MKIDHTPKDDGNQKRTDPHGAGYLYELLTDPSGEVDWPEVKRVCTPHPFITGNSLADLRIEPYFFSQAGVRLAEDQDADVQLTLLAAAIEYVAQTHDPAYEVFACAAAVIVRAADILANDPIRRSEWQSSLLTQTVVDLSFLCTHGRGVNQYQADLALASAILLLDREPLEVLVPSVVEAFRIFEPSETQNRCKDEFAEAKNLFEGFWYCVSNEVTPEAVRATDHIPGDSIFGAGLAAIHANVGSTAIEPYKNRLLKPGNPWQAVYFASIAGGDTLVIQSELVASLAVMPDSSETIALWGPRAALALRNPASRQECRLIWDYAAEKALNPGLAPGCRDFVRVVVDDLPFRATAQETSWTHAAALREKLYPNDLDRQRLEGTDDVSTAEVDEQLDAGQVYQDLCAYLSTRDTELIPTTSEMTAFEDYLRKGNKPVLYGTITLETPDLSVFYEAFNDLLATGYYFSAALCLGQAWAGLSDAVSRDGVEERDPAWQTATLEITDKLWRVIVLALESEPLLELVEYACCDLNDSIDTIRGLAAGSHIKDADLGVESVDLREASLVAAAFLDLLDRCSPSESERSLREHLRFGRTTSYSFKNFAPIMMVRVMARFAPATTIDMVERLIHESPQYWWVAAGLGDTFPDHAPRFFGWFSNGHSACFHAAEAVSTTARDFYEHGERVLDLIGARVARRKVSLNSLSVIARVGYRVEDVATVLRALGEFSDPSTIRDLCGAVPQILDRIDKRSRRGGHVEVC